MRRRFKFRCFFFHRVYGGRRFCDLLAPHRGRRVDPGGLGETARGRALSLEEHRMSLERQFEGTGSLLEPLLGPTVVDICRSQQGEMRIPDPALRLRPR